ncbi:hypothetical protein ONS96_014051 [Cadophora gregata f. sp. sojae]|nr:hypothetical protein ONS96_014051 [Cadophora gregata f. sp. sojae]
MTRTGRAPKSPVPSHAPIDDPVYGNITSTTLPNHSKPSLPRTVSKVFRKREIQDFLFLSWQSDYHLRRHTDWLRGWIYTGSLHLCLGSRIHPSAVAVSYVVDFRFGNIISCLQSSPENGPLQIIVPRTSIQIVHPNFDSSELCNHRAHIPSFWYTCQLSPRDQHRPTSNTSDRPASSMLHPRH